MAKAVTALASQTIVVAIQRWRFPFILYSHYKNIHTNKHNFTSNISVGQTYQLKVRPCLVFTSKIKSVSSYQINRSLFSSLRSSIPYKYETLLFSNTAIKKENRKNGFFPTTDILLEEMNRRFLTYDSHHSSEDKALKFN